MKTITGKVTSDKSLKTVSVEVTRLWKHPIYNKRVKRTKTYLAHNEIGAKAGEKVIISQTRPISKRKHFEVTQILTKSQSASGGK